MKAIVKKFGSGGAHIIVPVRFIGQTLDIPGIQSDQDIISSMQLTIDNQMKEIERLKLGLNWVKEEVPAKDF